jgi:hypothetical protein
MNHEEALFHFMPSRNKNKNKIMGFNYTSAPSLMLIKSNDQPILGFNLGGLNQRKMKTKRNN